MPLKEFDIPFEDTAMHCWEGGDGFPILMMHGSGAGASIPGNYRRVIESLARKYRVLAADLIGFGLSGRKSSRPYFDMDLWLRQARHLLRRFDGEAGIIGHSLSGALALKLAASDSRITRVLTTGTMGASFACKPGTRLWRYPDTRELLRQSIETTVWDKQLIDDAEVDYRSHILAQPGYREYYESMFDGDKQHYIDISALTPEELARISASVLMMHGRQDVSFPPENTCMVLARALPADVWLINNCGHSVALEYPEKFLAGADLLFSGAGVFDKTPIVTIGLPVKRREDERFLRGRGRFVDDHSPRDPAHVALVRSPHAHARIRRIDTTQAIGMPGVLGILTGDDWEAAGFGELPCIWRVDSRDGTTMNEASRPALASGDGTVRHVGDIVAAVVAASRAQAVDAAESVEVDYQPLPAIVETARALGPTVPLVHERFGTNLCFDIDFGNRGEVTAAFARAVHITRLELVNNRIAPSPLEPRATVGLYDPDDDKYTLWTSSQNPHLVRHWLAVSSLKIPEHRVRVISPDVGGGFGQKISHYPEEPIVLWASRLFGRPVRWTGTRSENLLEDTQARDHVTSCGMAFDADGRILALEVDTVAAIGAYATAFGPAIPGYFYVPLLAGMYRTPAIFGRVRAVYTNTVPVDAYRGAGRPEATYVVERLLDAGAREMGIDAREIRRRNFLHPADFPYVSPVGMRYDSGNYPGLMNKLEEFADYAALSSEQARLRGEGKYMGIGLAGFIDSSGGSPSRIGAQLGRRIASWDSAVVRVHPSGKITVFCGGHSHGQGHATAFAQIVAERMQCPVDDVEIVEGDTDRIPYGHGTYGSRSLSVIGVAIALATDKVVAKGAKIAAHLLECAEGDVAFVQGRYAVAGTDRSVPFASVVHAAHHLDSYPPGAEAGLEETSFYDPPGRNVPAALHLCVVLVDVDTGKVTVRDFWAIDDVGRVINPMIVEGQIHGGIAQGVGQALMEAMVYDSEGQILTGSLMDYALPRADDLPSFKTARQETLAPDNLLGVKGAGESGTIGAPAALVNAVVDALAPLGIRHLDMPLTPLRVWAAIQSARSA